MKLSNRLAELDKILKEIEELTYPLCGQSNNELSDLAYKINNMVHEGRVNLFKARSSLSKEDR